MAYEKGKLQLFVLPQEQFQIIMTNSSGEAEAGFIFSKTEFSQQFKNCILSFPKLFVAGFGPVTKVELNGETIKSLYTPHTIVPSEPNEIYIDFTRGILLTKLNNMHAWVTRLIIGNFFSTNLADASITIIINKVTTIGMPYPDDERLGNFETLFFGGSGMEKQSTLFYNCNYLRY